MRYILAMALALFLASPALAGFDGPNAQPGKQYGFSGPIGGAEATTVAKARTLGDDARVILTGNIVSKLVGSSDDYMFKDSTGEIRVDIDDKYFHGLKVTPADTVRISGKVDKDFGEEIEIDVKSLEIVK